MKKFCDINWALQKVCEFKNTYNQNMSQGYFKHLINTTYLGGKRTNCKEVLYILIDSLGLCELDNDDCLVITYRGNKLLEAGKRASYDLNQKQKGLLATWYIRANRNISDEWIKLFIEEEDNYVCYYNTIPLKLRQFTEEMKYFDVVKQENDKLNLRTLYYWLLANVDGIINEEELLKRLEKQRQIGKIAEEFVYEVELKRLKSEGLDEEAAKVKVISNDYVNAGYDIMSFSSKSNIHNRFIEVKCIGEDNKYYWSRNEIDVARQLRDKYFLYLVKDIRSYPTIWIIKNPYTSLQKFNVLVLPVQYEYHVNFTELETASYRIDLDNFSVKYI